MKTIAKDRRKQKNAQRSARGVGAVSSDLDKLLGPKSLEELEKLEKQIKAKLSSSEPIDTDYWEHLLSSLLTYKAKAKLRKVSKAIAESRVGGLRKQQVAEAEAWKERLEAKYFATSDYANGSSSLPERNGETHDQDPEPMLRLSKEDRNLKSTAESDFAEELVADRRKVLRQGYVGFSRQGGQQSALEPAAKRQRMENDQTNSAPQPGGSHFDREVAKGLGENEEIFTTEEPVTTKNLSSWSTKYRARKPQYFNRVLLGYEWNKYNQTHYDADNPPPRVVQGYKFNVFYPDLVDKTKAPTYRIEREGGRRKGETWAAAGEQDTCVIRFTAGPPYEDVAFRIVDREWDFSAKRERGFKSSFDKGILQLHFQFKKVCHIHWKDREVPIADLEQIDLLSEVTSNVNSSARAFQVPPSAITISDTRGVVRSACEAPYPYPPDGRSIAQWSKPDTTAQSPARKHHAEFSQAPSLFVQLPGKKANCIYPRRQRFADLSSLTALDRGLEAEVLTEGALGD